MATLPGPIHITCCMYLTNVQMRGKPNTSMDNRHEKRHRPATSVEPFLCQRHQKHNLVAVNVRIYSKYITQKSRWHQPNMSSCHLSDIFFDFLVPWPIMATNQPFVVLPPSGVPSLIKALHGLWTCSRDQTLGAWLIDPSLWSTGTFNCQRW